MDGTQNMKLTCCKVYTVAAFLERKERKKGIFIDTVRSKIIRYRFRWKGDQRAAGSNSRHHIMDQPVNSQIPLLRHRAAQKCNRSGQSSQTKVKRVKSGRKFIRRFNASVALWPPISNFLGLSHILLAASSSPAVPGVAKNSVITDFNHILMTLKSKIHSKMKVYRVHKQRATKWLR